MVLTTNEGLRILTVTGVKIPGDFRRIGLSAPSVLLQAGVHIPWLAKTLWQPLLSLARFC